VGAIFAHAVVGGFVEPDEEKLNASTNSTKLRVFAAGSFTNFAISMLFVLLLVNFPATIAPFYNTVESGVRIGSIPANMPAQVAGLQAGDIVMSINGTTISGLSDLREYMSGVVPGEDIVLRTQSNSYIVRTAADPNNSTRAVIGISDLTNYILYSPKMPFLSSELPAILLRAEFWLQLFLVSVAVINMLPIPPFDGDKFLETALKVLGIKNPKPIRITASFVALSLLILNFALSGPRFGLFLRV
jgi:membrane-associated protease RseP (regulator of RpoE activity)